MLAELSSDEIAVDRSLGPVSEMWETVVAQVVELPPRLSSDVWEQIPEE